VRTVAAVLVYGWVAGVRTFTQPAAVLTGIPIVAVAVTLLARRRRARPTAARPDGRWLTAWSGLVLATAGWELHELMGSPRHDYPTISSMGDAALRTARPVHALVFIVWLAVGYRLARGPAEGRAS
jgi:hypothetical protein